MAKSWGADLDPAAGILLGIRIVLQGQICLTGKMQRGGMVLRQGEHGLGLVHGVGVLSQFLEPQAVGQVGRGRPQLVLGGGVFVPVGDHLGHALFGRRQIRDARKTQGHGLVIVITQLVRFQLDGARSSPGPPPLSPRHSGIGPCHSRLRVIRQFLREFLQVVQGIPRPTEVVHVEVNQLPPQPLDGRQVGRGLFSQGSAGVLPAWRRRG